LLATYLINCISHFFLNTQPFQKLHGHQCDVSMLKVYGCLCYINTNTSQSKKLELRAHPCIFLGLPPHTKGYLTYNLHTYNILISCNVNFYEDHFSSLHHQHNDTPPNTNSPLHVIVDHTVAFSHQFTDIFTKVLSP